jgi:hypothetical protein
MKVKLGENLLSAGVYIIVIGMFMYAFASAAAIAHPDYFGECTNCAFAKNVISDTEK